MFKWEKEAEELFGEMRDLTDEERRSVNDYIESISVPTGFNIWDLYESENDKNL